MDGIRIEDVRGTVRVLQMKPDRGGRVQRKESKCLGRGMLRLERAGRRWRKSREGCGECSERGHKVTW